MPNCPAMVSTIFGKLVAAVRVFLSSSELTSDHGQRAPGAQMVSVAGREVGSRSPHPFGSGISQPSEERRLHGHAVRRVGTGRGPERIALQSHRFRVISKASKSPIIPK